MCREGVKKHTHRAGKPSHPGPACTEPMASPVLLSFLVGQQPPSPQSARCRTPRHTPGAPLFFAKQACLLKRRLGLWRGKRKGGCCLAPDRALGRTLLLHFLGSDFHCSNRILEVRVSIFLCVYLFLAEVYGTQGFWRSKSMAQPRLMVSLCRQCHRVGAHVQGRTGAERAETALKLLLSPWPIRS